VKISNFTTNYAGKRRREEGGGGGDEVKNSP
jgi:hypothetical protein